jgi:chromosome segregation ATPase
MTDDTHMASRLGVEAAQGIDGMLQRFAAQGSETLVDKEGIHRELGADVAEGKCQGERDEEAFTTLPHEDNIDALVIEAEKLYKDAENEYNKILTSQNALDADIKALKNSLANEQKVFAKCSESLAKATQKAQEAAKKIPEGENGEAQTRANLEKASAQIAEAEAKEKEAKKLRTLRDQKLQEYEVQRNGMLAAQQKVDDTQHRIEVIEAQISLQNKNSEKALQDIHLLIGEAGNLSWQNDWHTMLTEFGKEVEDGAITYKMNTEKQQKLVAELKQFEEGNKNLAAALDAIIKLIPTWGTPSKEPQMLKRIPKVLTRASELQSQGILAC